MSERRRVTIMEAVEPDPTSFDTRMMARGEPGVPMRFTWRRTTYRVAEILDTRRETEPAPEGGGSEHYVRRHIVRVRTTSGDVMALSGSRGTRARAPRWTIRYVEADDA